MRGGGAGGGGGHPLDYRADLVTVWLLLINHILHSGREDAGYATVEVKGRAAVVALELPDFQLPLEAACLRVATSCHGNLGQVSEQYGFLACGEQRE